MITPAISVLSAVEGLTTVEAELRALRHPDRDRHPRRPVRHPVARHGAGRRCCSARSCWSISRRSRCSASIHIVDHPAMLLEHAQPAQRAAILHRASRCAAFIAMGSVVLAVTGAEALYADMGHFGRRPIRVSWLYFVLPALLLNYMGQGAMLLAHDARAGASRRSRTRSSSSRPRCFGCRWCCSRPRPRSSPARR